MEQVAEEAESLKESLDKYSARKQKKMNEAKERAELLGRAVRNFRHGFDFFLFFMLFLLYFYIRFLMLMCYGAEWRVISCYSGVR